MRQRDLGDTALNQHAKIPLKAQLCSQVVDRQWKIESSHPFAPDSHLQTENAQSRTRFKVLGQKALYENMRVVFQYLAFGGDLYSLLDGLISICFVQ